jgi:hypothetical protein
MPRSLPPIPAGVPIAEKDGGITTFFRLRWQQLVDGWAQTGSVSLFTAIGRTAALVTTSIYTTLATGKYRVSWYLRKTRPDGAASSVTVTLGWIDLDSQALTVSGAPLTLDAAAAVQTGMQIVRCLSASDITVAVAYSSTTPGQMRYDLEMTVEYVP